MRAVLFVFDGALPSSASTDRFAMPNRFRMRVMRASGSVINPDSTSSSMLTLAPREP